MKVSYEYWRAAKMAGRSLPTPALNWYCGLGNFIGLRKAEKRQIEQS